MVNRNLLRQFDLHEEELQHELQQVFTTYDNEANDWLPPEAQQFETNKIVTGRVVNIVGDDVVVDVGYKSEGIIARQEWYDEGLDQIVQPQVGDEIQVLLDAVEDEGGAIVLSYRKARRQKEWEDVLARFKEGDVVSGLVTRKIKGGLLVNIECKILKIDETRRNIVVSRRKLLEDQRAEMKDKLLREIKPGQVRLGVIKNIADFGAFIDLGGLDGLLHVTDMSWVRVTNPHELFHIDQQLEALVLAVDKEREKIALGLKQMTPSPWAGVADKYPLGSRHTGEVVNVMTYGAFVKLEPGVEGLVHISEMSWLKRVNHPTELVSIGDSVEVQVLGINKEKQEISLGMKQVQPNPWDKVAQRYSQGTIVTGTVRNLTNYGAFLEIEQGIDGLLHVGDMSWLRKVAHPSEVVNKGDPITCVVLNVDQQRKRIALGLKQMTSDPWEEDIPGRYQVGDWKKGKVTKLTSFGAFVELEPGLEGLLHISELADHKVGNPEDLLKLGDEIEVKVLRVDAGERKIGLTRKSLGSGKGPVGEADEETAEGTPRPPRELRGGTGSGGGSLFNIPESGSEKK